jgi:hypothetical protein
MCVTLLICFSLLALGWTLAPRSAEAAAAARKPAAGKAAKPSCKSCHPDLAAALPAGHPEAAPTLAACTASCHDPAPSDKAQRNPFSARMHRAHLGGKAGQDCTACHVWVPGKTFALIGQKVSFGAPRKDELALAKEIFASWAGSTHTDAIHAKAGVTCSGCHGAELPLPDATVENSRCLACHGPVEPLVKKTEPKDFKDRNPHKSHLGDINCRVCHRAHAQAKIYCLDCHQYFKMRIAGAP